MAVRKPQPDPDRPERVRRANQRIAAKAQRLRFVSRVPMLCECGDPGCDALVLVALQPYHALRGLPGYLTAPGHHLQGAAPALKLHGYWFQS